MKEKTLLNQTILQIKLILAVISGCILTSISWSQTQTVVPDSIELTYSVKLGHTELGTLASSLEKIDDRYQVESKTRAEGLAAILLGGEVKEQCEFKLSQDLFLKPYSYQRGKEGRGAYHYAADFVWEDNQIRYQSGEIIDIPLEGYVIDNCSVPYAFMMKNTQSVTEHPYIHVIGENRIRHYESIKVAEEVIETKLGKLSTKRIDQHRVNRPDRVLTVWVAPQFQNIVVKIVERRKSRVTTMEINSLEGL